MKQRNLEFQHGSKKVLKKYPSPINFFTLTVTECNRKKRKLNKRTVRMTETNQELDRIIIESFRHNQFPDQQKAALKEIRLRKEELNEDEKAN